MISLKKNQSVEFRSPVLPRSIIELRKAAIELARSINSDNIYRSRNKRNLFDRYCFPAVFYREDKGGYSVIFPDLDGHGANTQGENFEDAQKSAKEVLEMVLYWMEKENEVIPAPSAPEKIVHPKNAFIVMIEV